MENIKKKVIEFVIMLCIGGVIYCTVELLFRGRSHISMFFLGGFCFWFMGNESEIFGKKVHIFVKMLIAAIGITFVELLVGLLVNVRLQLAVWDYSKLPWNFMGQICVHFSIYWFLLSYPGIKLAEFVKDWMETQMETL